MLINIYKPPGITSHDVVDKVRKILKEKRTKTQERSPKVGHGGTLDPFAEGVLVIGVGRESTKKLGNITQNTKKEYLATLELGKTSTTGDPEGEIHPVRSNFTKVSQTRAKSTSKTSNGVNNYQGNDLGLPDVKSGQAARRSCHSERERRIPLNENQNIKLVLNSFLGKITQTPPKYSAIRINGKRAYKLAREGKDFKMPEREVEIYEIELIEYKYPKLQPVRNSLAKVFQARAKSTSEISNGLKIRVLCSSGTYIRTLAEDIGRKLGTGAYLTKLIRTKVGEYKVEDSKTLKELEKSFIIRDKTI